MRSTVSTQTALSKEYPLIHVATIWSELSVHVTVAALSMVLHGVAATIVYVSLLHVTLPP